MLTPQRCLYHSNFNGTRRKWPTCKSRRRRQPSRLQQKLSQISTRTRIHQRCHCLNSLPGTRRRSSTTTKRKKSRSRPKHRNHKRMISISTLILPRCLFLSSCSGIRKRWRSWLSKRKNQNQVARQPRVEKKKSSIPMLIPRP